MKKWLFGLSVAIILPACVTINIYFPAAAAEKAADKVIEEVWQLKDAQTKPPDGATKATPTKGAADKALDTKEPDIKRPYDKLPDPKVNEIK